MPRIKSMLGEMVKVRENRHWCTKIEELSCKNEDNYNKPMN